jgi:hypothetical protein
MNFIQYHVNVGVLKRLHSFLGFKMFIITGIESFTFKIFELRLINRGGFKMKRGKVKQIFQQFLIAVVVFSLICPGSLWAKREKAGATIIVTKEDGQVVEGELLQVEDDSLLLLIYETLAKVIISINEIEKIKIKQKSKVRKRTKTGALVLGIPAFALGCLLGAGYASISETPIQVGLISGGVILGVIGAVVGFGIGAGANINPGFSYPTYQVKGKSTNKKTKILEKLKKRARFKD